jgi:hypothetical protein
MSGKECAHTGKHTLSDNTNCQLAISTSVTLHFQYVVESCGEVLPFAKFAYRYCFYLTSVPSHLLFGCVISFNTCNVSPRDAARAVFDIFCITPRVWFGFCSSVCYAIFTAKSGSEAVKNFETQSKLYYRHDCSAMEAVSVIEFQLYLYIVSRFTPVEILHVCTCKRTVRIEQTDSK